MNEGRYNEFGQWASDLIRDVLWQLWPLVEWLLNKGIDVLEWLRNDHEDWFDRLVVPVIEKIENRGSS